jgi:hypothetical protein
MELKLNETLCPLANGFIICRKFSEPKSVSSPRPKTLALIIKDDKNERKDIKFTSYNFFFIRLFGMGKRQ